MSWFNSTHDTGGALESSEITLAFLPLLVQRRHVARGPQVSAAPPPKLPPRNLPPG